MLREGTTSVEDLAERVGVSESTVRRDLERLRAEGAVARTYGGAMVTAPFHERSIAESAREGHAAKAAIARAALAMVPTEGLVFLDAGTTCGALARLLVDSGEHREHGTLTVATRGLETAVALADAEHIEVIVLGGRLRRMSHGLVGPLADLAVERLAFDVAFLGADVVDPDRGVGEPTVEETSVKEQVAARAARTVVLADAAKLAAPPTPAWTRLDRAWTLVTDDPSPDLAKRCEASGVELVVAS
jgi:DeoR/GlpR family transcriptional regulator of sugar metabolism